MIDSCSNGVLSDSTAPTADIVEATLKKKAAANERKKASRLRIMADPKRKKDALKKNRKYSKKYYSQHKKKIATQEYDMMKSEHLEPARKKWDQAYYLKHSHTMNQVVTTGSTALWNSGKSTKQTKKKNEIARR